MYTRERRHIEILRKRRDASMELISFSWFPVPYAKYRYGTHETYENQEKAIEAAQRKIERLTQAEIDRLIRDHGGGAPVFEYKLVNITKTITQTDVSNIEL